MNSGFVKTTKLSLFDGIEMKEAVFQKHSFPLHYHDTYCFRLIEKGIEQEEVENKSIPAHAGSVLILNPNEIHSNKYYDGDKWKYRTIFVNKEVINHINKKNNQIPKTTWFTNELIDNPFIFQKLMNFHSEGFDRRVLLNEIVTYLTLHYRAEQVNLHYSNPTINEISFYLQNNFSKKNTLEELARKYHINKFNFIRMFKKQIGITPLSYLILQRISQAKEMIVKNIPITEVALDTGFYDQSHFNHYFKKYMGVSPLEYKEGFQIQ